MQFNSLQDEASGSFHELNTCTKFWRCPAGAILPVDGGCVLTSWLNTDVQPVVKPEDAAVDRSNKC